jgi:NAD(P)H-hydrate epimerase
MKDVTAFLHARREKALSVKEMRKVDARAVSLGLPVYLMMENAGNALANYMVGGLGNNLAGKKITVVCGLSNNGGGGFASARHLSYYGAKVTVILLGKPRDIRTDGATLQWKTIEGVDSISKIVVSRNTKEELQRIRQAMTGADGIIDAILGTGYSSKKIRGPASSAIDLVNASTTAYVVSNDVPSGIDPDTGMVPDKAISPDITVVLHQMKRRLHDAGNKVVVSIGIPQR